MLRSFIFVVLTFTTLQLFPSKTDSLLNLVNNSPKSERFDLWINIGLSYRESGNFDSATFAFNKALAFADSDAKKGTYHHSLGSLNWRFGKYTNAILHYDSAIALRNTNELQSEKIKSLYYKSLVYRDMSEYDKSMEISKYLVDEYTRINDSSGLANMFSQLGSIYVRLNQFDSAHSWFRKAADIRFIMKDTSKMAASYSNLAQVAKETNQFEEAVSNYRKALDLYLLTRDKSKIAYTYLLLGGTFWASKQYQNALDNYLKSLKIYEFTENKQQVASVLNNIGLIYRDIGNIDKAIEYHLRSLEEYQNIGNKPRIGIALNILAGDYWSMGNFNHALMTYQRALKIRKELGNKTQIAGTYNNIALVFKGMNQSDSALSYYNLSLELYREIHDKHNQAALLNNIGNLFKKERDYKKSLQYLNDALALRKQIHDAKGIGYSSLNIGEVLFEINKMKLSKQQLLHARKIAIDLNDAYLKQESCLLLSKIAKNYNLHKEALTFYEEYHDAEKQLRLDESIRRVADMQIRFEAEKTQRLREKKQAEIERKDAELRAQRMRIYFLFGLLVLFAGLIVVVVIAFIQKRKSNKLLALRNNEIEEQKVEIEAQRDLATQQRDKISEQNQKITDSILYGKRIQNALLPPDNQMDKYLKEHFIIFRPRDMVSGDFYYFQPHKNYTVISAADCTGHGVPGAFMSMLGISLLNEIIASEEIENAANILESLREKVKSNLHQTSVTESNTDGMDMALIMLDRSKMELHFAGANNPLLIIRNNELTCVDGDRMPIGLHIHDEEPFKNHIIKLEKGDKLYMFSDGFTDQFGGKQGRKLMSKNFKKLILDTSSKTISEQKETLEKFFEQWKGNYRQIDDVLVMGLEI
jgi:tetratricopeptide (TPR) repeat protein